MRDAVVVEVQGLGIKSKVAMSLLLFMIMSVSPAGPITYHHDPSTMTPSSQETGGIDISSTGGASLPPGSVLLKAAPSGMHMYITVSFQLRNVASLERLIAEQQDPSSPVYHHFLTQSEFQRMFGPSRRTYSETLSYFESMGMKFVQTGSDLTLGFSATAGETERAFHTHIAIYSTQSGAYFYSNSETLSLPYSIGRAISSVNGLSNANKIHPMLVENPLIRDMPGKTHSFNTGAASTMVSVVNITHPGFLYTPHNFTLGMLQFLNPAALTVAYNASPLLNMGVKGKGVTIAVVMAEGYNPSDLANYSQMVFNNSEQILSRISSYPVAGANGNASTPGSSYLRGEDAFELSLDIEYAATMAPEAHIDAVYGPSLSLASLVSAYAKLTSLIPLPNIVSNSWGGSEDTWWNLYGPSWQSASALENYFMELTSMGSTVLASSGDSGGYDVTSTLLSVSFPASSPYVLAVGGVRTVVANASDVPFPYPPDYFVNTTLAPYGYSETESYPSWFPNVTLYASYVGRTYSNSYWYLASPYPDTPDYASGGAGLSYWFTQPWWQHGPAVPYAGRRMVSDLAAEADFNQTVYFDGAWNFFWGGTSFASPTVAGELALMENFLNITVGNTTGRGSFYLGLAQPLIYTLGNDNHLPLEPFFEVASGSNRWDSILTGENMGWPGHQNWPSRWTSATSGWSLLTGFGVPDVYAMAVDMRALLAVNSTLNALHVEFSNGSAAEGELPASGLFVFRAVRNNSVQPGTDVLLSYYGAGGDSNQSVVTGTDGEFAFNASGRHGYLSIYLVSGNDSGFDSIWFYQPPLENGTLHIKVSESSITGGFDDFNGFISPSYPAAGPLMPNSVYVNVTYSPVDGNVMQVYDAEVIAAAPDSLPFSSPPFYTNANYSLNALNADAYSAIRSLSYTNLLGRAIVYTWNVNHTEVYHIYAYYRGLMANTTVNVTPQYVITGANSASDYYSVKYGYLSGYLGSGAEHIVVAPGVEGTAQYTLPIRLLNWRGEPIAGAVVDLARPDVAVPYNMVPVSGTQVYTDAAGIAELNITPELYYSSLNYGGMLFIQAFNGSYSAKYMDTPLLAFPVDTNDSSAVLLFTSPSVAEVQTAIDAYGFNSIPTQYIGSQEGSVEFYISVADSAPFTNNSISSIGYSIDNVSNVKLVIGSVPQRSYLWNFRLPTMELGKHTVSVIFSDAYGFNYSATYIFYVIGEGIDPPPTVTFTSPADYAFVTGRTTINFTTLEEQYLVSETLSIGSAVYSVIGENAFTFNASQFGYGELLVTIEAMNVNGVTSTSKMILYSTPDPVPVAQITSPSNGEVFASTSSISIGLYHSGDYIDSSTLKLSGPVSMRFNVTSNTLILRHLSPGKYTATYTVRSLDGLNATSVVNFTVAGPSYATSSPYYLSTFAEILMAILFFAGVLSGLSTALYLRRKK